MANRRFIDFPIATTVGDSDIILIWQSGVNKQTTKATFLSGLPENLDELNDVAISGLTNGQILRYDSVTGKWENTDQGNLDLNDLNDVSIVSPSNGQVLVYNSSTSKWENSSGGFVPYIGAVTTVNLGAQTIQAGQFVKAGGTSSQFLKADGSIDSTAYGTGSVTSVGLTMPSAFNVANSPITSAGTLAVTGAGTVAQYIRGDGSLADFPEASGGGSSISYYLNGSVNQGTIGGVAYKELNKVPILGAGTDFTINADGYIASFITDAGDPNLLEIPGGNWNFETYFSASSGGGSPTFYVELYKVSGTTATLIASNSSAPELIAFGTNITAYFSSLAVPTTTLALTDRLAIRYYVTHSGRTITLHTEDNHLCQIVTTFTTGLTALNGLTAQVQNFAVGTTGTDFNIASATATHTFNLPTASATNRGALSSTDWTTFNSKQNALTNPVTGTGAAGRVAYWNGSGTITSDSLFQWNDFSKRLGIGRTPTVSLDVEGAGFFSGTVTASSIIKSGGTSSQYLMADGSVSTLTNPVTGSGTTNYLPKFTGSTTIGNSAITDDGTTVNLISRDLTITRGSYAAFSFGIDQQSTFAFGSTNGRRVAIIRDSTAADNGLQFGYDTIDKTGIIAGSATSAGAGIDFYTYNGSAWGNRARVTASGNLLVGTTTDNGARLQVSGTAQATKLVSASNAFAGTLDFGTGSFKGIMDYTASTGLWSLNNQTAGSSTTAYFQFQADSTPILTMLKSGNVGIGTSSPTGELHIFGSQPAFRIQSSVSGNMQFGQWDSTNNRIQSSGRDFLLTQTDAFNMLFHTNNTERMRITSGGNVGIGTTSPNGKLRIQNDNSTIPSLIVRDGGTPTANLIEATSNAYGNSFIVTATGNVGIGTASPDSFNAAADNLVVGTTSGNNGITIVGQNNAFSCLFFADGTTGNDAFRGFIQYNHTGDNFEIGTAGTERMRITSGGEILVSGTYNPFPATNRGNITLNGSASNIITFTNNVTPRGYIFHTGTNLEIVNATTSGVLQFYTESTERARITAGGNVLIGTTTDPGAKLHVNGDIRTAAPSGGSAVNWKLGTARGGTITPNAIVRVEIAGVLVDLDARYV